MDRYGHHAMDVEAKPYLLAEAAQLTGLSVDAIRKRVIRLKWRGVRSNTDGQWRVWLTDQDIETAKSRLLTDRNGHVQDSQVDIRDSTIRALEAEAATLRERTTNAVVERDMARAGQAAAQAEAAAERLRAEEARIRAAAAEGELRGLRDTMARELRQLEQAEAALKAAETQRDAAQAARDAAQHDLFGWTAGGPVARAWRAFTNRRGRG